MPGDKMIKDMKETNSSFNHHLKYYLQSLNVNNGYDKAISR